MPLVLYTLLCFFFFNDTATTEIYTLSLHDALPIYQEGRPVGRGHPDRAPLVPVPVHAQQLCQSGKRVREDLALAVGPYFELHLGGVIDPAIHAGMIAPPGARVTSRRPG